MTAHILRLIFETMQTKLKLIIANGYQHHSRYEIDCNIISFRKQEGERFAVIECTTEQLKMAMLST